MQDSRSSPPQELASYQGKAGHGVLDAAQQIQGHWCWGERKGVSNSLLDSAANPLLLPEIPFHLEEPGFQVGSGQGAPRDLCSWQIWGQGGAEEGKVSQSSLSWSG